MNPGDHDGIWMLYVDPNKSFSVDPGPLNYFKNNFVGVPMAGNWVPPETTYSNTRARPKDFISWMPCSPVVSADAKLALQQLENMKAEFLPLFVRSGNPFFAMNITQEVELDRDKSTVEYFDRERNEIMMVRSAYFDLKGSRAPTAFKIQGYAGDIYVNDAFASAVRRAGLTGATFLDPRKDVLSRVLGGKVPDDFIP